VPLRLKLNVSKVEVKRQGRSEGLWKTVVRDRLIAQMRDRQISEAQIDEAAALRQKVAEAMFPLEEPPQEAIYRADYFEGSKKDYVEF
jgi:hypothetical protein